MIPTIKYEIIKAGRVQVSVQGALWYEVATLIDTLQSARAHVLIFNAGTFGNGYYFYQFNAGGVVNQFGLWRCCV